MKRFAPAGPLVAVLCACAVFNYLKPEVARVARRDDNADQVPQWRQGR